MHVFVFPPILSFRILVNLDYLYGIYKLWLFYASKEITLLKVDRDKFIFFN